MNEDEMMYVEGGGIGVFLVGAIVGGYIYDHVKGYIARAIKKNTGWYTLTNAHGTNVKAYFIGTKFTQYKIVSISKA